MKTNLVKAALALTLISATASATAHQLSSNNWMKSDDVPVKTVNETASKPNQKTAVYPNHEYVISYISQPSLDDACAIEEVLTVKLKLLDNDKGELRLYDGDANVLGIQEVVFTDDERTGREVKNKLQPKTKASNSVVNIGSNNVQAAAINAVDDLVEQHAIDPVISFQTEDKNGTDKVSICLARNQEYILAQQAKADKTCGKLLIKISCPDLDVFTTVILKARCDFKRSSIPKSAFVD